MDTRPPPPPPPPVAAAPPVPRASYRELAGGVRPLVLLLAASIVVGLAGFVLDVMQFSLIGRILFASADAIARNDARMGWLGWSQVVVSAGAAAAFVAWLRKARGNLPALGLAARRGIDPRSALDDVWAAAAIAPGITADPWAHTFSAYSFYRWWWPSVVAAAALLAGGRALAVASDVTLLRAATVLFVLGDVALIVAAIVGTRVVKDISTHMDARALALRSERHAGPAFVS